MSDVACPGCGLLMDEKDTGAQLAHMQEAHPEIIAARLEAAGFELRDGEWFDTLAEPR